MPVFIRLTKLNAPLKRSSVMMKTTSLFVLLLFFACSNNSGVQTANDQLTMLCLGDSYTIGESVTVEQRFPMQTIELLKQEGIVFSVPKIIARTGWTTDELMSAIEEEEIVVDYDAVTLLIGVNNQYRERSTENYREEFIYLLEKAIHFAGDKPNHVFVLSIPDWGQTPFAEGRDREKVWKEIDEFNAINKEESEKHLVHYLDITPITRRGLLENDLIAGDKLHPSGKMYSEWAALLVDQMLQEFNQ